MGDPRGFLNIKRVEAGYRPVEERVNDYREVEIFLSDEERRLQASRCMDCGVPFCHWGCPIGNIMPEWQDLIFKGDWHGAYRILKSTNNFPEFTGRVCPAPCEASCVLSINSEPVTIRQNELSVIEKAFELGYVKPEPPNLRTGKKVAIVGSGPAGLAAADLLNKKGHLVTVFEAADAIGGYLRFGIPDFKLDKKIIDRRLDILKAEGIEFKTSIRVGKDISSNELIKNFDALLLAIGSRVPRDLKINGRELKGVYFAMEYLEQQNRIVSGQSISERSLISPMGKRIVVIGGGDTGSDCVGNANRQGAKSITQIEIMPEPPLRRTEDEPWPLWPKLKKTSSSHEEGCERLWNIKTLEFIGEKGILKGIRTIKVKWEKDSSGNMIASDIPGTEEIIPADIVLLSMGFVHPEYDGPVYDFDLSLDNRGNIAIDNNYMTSKKGVFSAGDSVRGASLVVWAIHQGREAALHIDSYLSNGVI